MNNKKRKLDKIEKDETGDIIAELEEKIVKMEVDREGKCAAAKKQLVEMLEVTVDKYRTATGTAEALRILRFVSDGMGLAWNDLEQANELAWTMAGVASYMAEVAKSLEPEEMDKLCDGFYDKEFKVGGEKQAEVVKIAEQMMRIDLCRNVGGAAEDMKSFVERVGEEIQATKKALDEAKAEREGK